MYFIKYVIQICYNLNIKKDLLKIYLFGLLLNYFKSSSFYK